MKSEFASGFIAYSLLHSCCPRSLRSRVFTPSAPASPSASLARFPSMMPFLSKLLGQNSLKSLLLGTKDLHIHSWYEKKNKMLPKTTADLRAKLVLFEEASLLLCDAFDPQGYANKKQGSKRPFSKTLVVHHPLESLPDFLTHNHHHLCRRRTSKTLHRRFEALTLHGPWPSLVSAGHSNASPPRSTYVALLVARAEEDDASVDFLP